MEILIINIKFNAVRKRKKMKFPEFSLEGEIYRISGKPEPNTPVAIVMCHVVDHE